MKTELTIEQSRRLIELGVDPNKASEIKEFDDPVSKWIHRGAPIFTLADLLVMLPKNIVVDGVTLNLTIEWHYKQWCIFYIGSHYPSKSFYHVELIDAIYSLLIWLIENRYLNGNESMD